MMRNRSVFQQISFRVSFTWNFRSGPEFCVCSSCQPSRVFLEEPEDQLLRQPNRGRWLCVKRLQRGTSSCTEPVTFTTLGWHLLQEGSRSETLCCNSHKEASGFPLSPLSNLTWAARTESLPFHCGSHYGWQVPPVSIFGWWQKWPLRAEWCGQLSRLPNQLWEKPR